MKTFDKMVEILRTGNVDVENFDKLSEKKLCELFSEWNEREVELCVIPAHGNKPAHIARVAVQAAILVVDPIRKIQYQETKRVLRSGKSIEKTRPWTITETWRRGNTIADEAVRAIRDELGFKVSVDQLNVGRQLYPDPYYSSVFYGIKTYAMIQMFEWRVTFVPWSETIKIVQDTSKEVHVQAFPYALAA